MKVTQNIILITLTLFCATMVRSTVYSQSAKNKVTKVVIDPGHGGRAPGTVYRNILEKDITLKVSLMLGELIKNNLPDVKVIYTRETDKDVELAERGNIANKAGADLFLSIHVDAVKGTSATGSSSYVMGMDKSQANLDVAMRENDVVSYEDDYTTKYEGYVPGSAESFIIFTLMQYANTDQSMLFASMIQKHYKRNTPIPDRGARQAPYLVLWKAAMPSVLTEIGFLSNPHDRSFLTTDAGQKKIARALFNAFSEYKSKVEGKPNPVVLADDGPGSASEKPTTDSSSIETRKATTQSVGTAKSSDSGKVFFTVQVCSSTSRISLNSPTFKSYKGNVTERKIGSLYKYFVGEYTSYSQAMTQQAKVRSVINGAFIVAFNGNEPCTVAEARKLISK